MSFLVIISGMLPGCPLFTKPFLDLHKIIRNPTDNQGKLTNTLLSQDPKVVRANDEEIMSPGDQLYLLPVIAYPDRSAEEKQY